MKNDRQLQYTECEATFMPRRRNQKACSIGCSYKRHDRLRHTRRAVVA